MRKVSTTSTGKATPLRTSYDDGALEGRIPHPSAGRMPDVQPRSHGGSDEKRGDGKKVDCDRARRTNNDDGRLRRRRARNERSVCSDGGRPQPQEHRVSCTPDNPPEAPSDGDLGLEKEPRHLSLPEAFRVVIDEAGDEENGLSGMVDVGQGDKPCNGKKHYRNSVPVLRDTGGLSTEGGKLSRAADGRLPDAGEQWSDKHDNDPETERSNSKPSPRKSASKVMTLATETADTPLEAAAEHLPSATEEPVRRRCKIVNRRENREYHTKGIEHAIEQHSKRTEQAKRLALEVARLRSALRGSNYDLEAERKARARLEDDHMKKMLTWENEREAIVSAKHDAERALRAAQEELDKIRMQDEAHRTKAKSEAAAGEASHRKAASALNGVIEVQDRLVRALRTEVDLTKRAKEAAQDDARETRERLRPYVQGFLTWRDRAKLLEARTAELLEARMAKLDHPQRQPDDCDGRSHSHARPTLSALAGKNYYLIAEKAKGGDGSLSTGGSVKWKDHECPAGNHLVELDGEDTRGSTDEDCSLRSGEHSCQRGVAGGRRCSPRDAVEAPQKSGVVRGNDHTNEAYRKDARELVDGNPLLLVSRVLGNATTEACPVDTASSRSREYFERSMKAQQDISARIERELAKTRDELHVIYASDVKNSSSTSILKKGATGATAALASQGDCDDPGSCFDSNQTAEVGGANVLEGPHEGDSCDDGTDPCADVKVSGPHLARVLAALLGAETTNRDMASRTEGVRKHIHGKRDRRATSGRGGGIKVVSSSPAPPCLRLSDYPSLVQAIFRGESASASPPLAEVPTALGDNKAYPAILWPQRGIHRRPAAAREKEGAATPAAPGKAEGCAVTVAFRAYEPKSPLLQMWLAEKCSAASPNGEEE